MSPTEEVTDSMEPSLCNLSLSSQYEVSGDISGSLALHHEGDVVPGHPRRGPPVDVVALGLLGTGNVLHDEIHVILA